MSAITGVAVYLYVPKYSWSVPKHLKECQSRRQFCVHRQSKFPFAAECAATEPAAERLQFKNTQRRLVDTENNLSEFLFVKQAPPHRSDSHLRFSIGPYSVTRGSYALPTAQNAAAQSRQSRPASTPRPDQNTARQTRLTTPSYHK